MGYRGHVPDASYNQPNCLKGTNGRLSSCAGALDVHLYLAKALVHALAGCLLRRPLGRESCALPGALEACRARAGGAKNVAHRIGEGNKGVIEGRMDIGPPPRHLFSFSFAASRFCHECLSTCGCRYGVRGQQQSWWVPFVYGR